EINANSHRGDYDIAYNMDQELLHAREVIARFISCDPNEVIFTSGTSMSLNMVAYGYGLKHFKKGDEILISEAEHASNVLPWGKVCELTGAVLRHIPLTIDGRITPENVEKCMNKNVKMVSLAAVSNVLGNSIDIKGIADVVHSYGALFSVDGAQSVPHTKTDFKGDDIDFLSFSGHKMLGPTGIGVLVGKYSLLEDMDPFLSGGGMNDKYDINGCATYLAPPAKFEAGTLNLEGILGLRRAVEYIEEIGIDNIDEYVKSLKRYCVTKLKELDNVTIYNPDSDSGIVTFNVNGVFSQDEASYLNSKGIAVRSGEHCDKTLADYLGVTDTCRASFYLYNTKEEIDYFVEALKNGGNFLDAFFD
ncbi:MAG: cysteine desulfurase, partial [Coprobacillus sp.]|nr:cysteine desulfurase [Coprobacillus sp.]